MPKVAKTQGKKAKKNTAAKARSAIPAIGREVGSLFGPLGSRVGGLAGAAIARVLGQGSYSVRGNTLASGQAPAFMSTENGMRVCHREFVTDVKSTTDFLNQFQYWINPGNDQLFPWLSQIANSFESYDLHGLVVTYKPTSGTAISSTSAAMGSVILSTEYDVLKPQFGSKRDAEAYQFTTVSVPYEGMMHPVECKPSLTVLPKKFVTSSTSPTGLASDDDPRLHYHGLLQCMTAGQQATGAVVGELWVSYDVTLFTPRLKPQLSALNLAIGEFAAGADVLTTASRFGQVIESEYSKIVFVGDERGGFQVPACTFKRTGYYQMVTSTVNHSTAGTYPCSFISLGTFSGGISSVNLDPEIDTQHNELRDYLTASGSYSIFTNAATPAAGATRYVYVSDPSTARYLFDAVQHVLDTLKGPVSFRCIFLGDETIRERLERSTFANARVADKIITESNTEDGDWVPDITTPPSTRRDGVVKITNATSSLSRVSSSSAAYQAVPRAPGL